MLERGDTLTLKTGTKVMVRRVQPPARGYDCPMVVLWSLGHGVQLANLYPMTYLLERIEDGTAKRGRRLDATRVISEASERNFKRGVASGD